MQTARLAANNSAPVFAATAVTRRIAENSTGNVGGPVTATDANNGDILTYSIRDSGDDLLFAIDPATGQLMVGDDTDLDFEDTNNPDDLYEVQVTAGDSSGTATATVAMVTINVFDVDEKPTFAENVTNDVVVENSTDTNLDIATYTATDPEGESVTLSLVGDDASLFELAADSETGNAVSQLLSFKKSPDFEMPGDRNQDNVYQVTVRASDGSLNADLMVTVKVTDVAEEGTVTLSAEQALVGVELTATLTDLDGGVSASGQITDESWTWQRGTTAENATNTIPDATSSTYTPVAADTAPDAGYVKAMVSYTYQFGVTEKMGTSDAIQVLTSRENQAPKFRDGSSTFRVVAENAPVDDEAASDNVGSPVVATDANGDTVIYTLGGSDKDLFEMGTEGQIEVKDGADLDHETKPTLTVTLTANDGSGTSNATANITVTIYVTDVDEPPVIIVGGLAISGPSSPQYAEGGTDAVATYTSAGPDADIREPDRHWHGQHVHGNGDGRRPDQHGLPERDGDGHQRGRDG